MGNAVYYIIPVLCLLGSAYGLFCELFNRWLQKHGQEASARVLSVDHTVTFGLRYYLGASAKKPEKVRQFGCDYIVTLRFPLPEGREKTTQTTVPARMKVHGGTRMPYLMEGDTVPIRYAPRFPGWLVVMLPESVARQSRIGKLILWGGSTILMAAILVAMAVLV